MSKPRRQHTCAQCNCWILRAPGTSAGEERAGGGDGAGLGLCAQRLGAALLMGDGEQTQLPAACLEFYQLKQEGKARV